jgi:hypothetical protein
MRRKRNLVEEHRPELAGPDHADADRTDRVEPPSNDCWKIFHVAILTPIAAARNAFEELDQPRAAI